MNLDGFYYINIKLNEPETNVPQNRTFNPPIDIYENDAGLNIELEIPSFTKEDISVCCESNRIKIFGNQNNQKKMDMNYLLLERNIGGFEKIIELPFSIDANKVKAKLKDGVLSIFIPF